MSAQDGALPPVDDVRRHEDSKPYRLAAIRECFEESGILLATSKENPKELLTLTDEEREHGRHAIHENIIDFQTWIAQRRGIPDIGILILEKPDCVLLITNRPLSENLIPFTRWLTPLDVPKRFSTQMYLYFLPIPAPSPLPSNSSAISQSPFPIQSRSNTVHIPTSDGGIEHTAAKFLPPSEWLSLYASYEILLFPPQYFLLLLISPFLSPSPSSRLRSSLKPAPYSSNFDIPTLHRRRKALIAFTRTGNPPWTEKCISAMYVSGLRPQKVLTLHEPGPELAGTHRKGDAERVMVAVGPKGKKLRWEVRWKSEVLLPVDTDRSGGGKL